MTKNESLLFSEISAFISRNPGLVMRTGLDRFILEVFFRISPFSISDDEIAEILQRPNFQAQLNDAGIGLWVGRSDRQIRLVDQIPHYPQPLRIRPTKDCCAYCLMPEDEPRIELVQEMIGTDRLIGSYVHQRCKKAMRTYRQIMEDNHV